jgi:hypothetical protein
MLPSASTTSNQVSGVGARRMPRVCRRGSVRYPGCRGSLPSQDHDAAVKCANSSPPGNGHRAWCCCSIPPQPTAGSPPRGRAGGTVQPDQRKPSSRPRCRTSAVSARRSCGIPPPPSRGARGSSEICVGREPRTATAPVGRCWLRDPPVARQVSAM